MLYVFSQKFHFLVVLLGLELGLIRVYVFTIKVLGVGTYLNGGNISILILVFGICEACIGLGLLVSRCRVRGLDNIGGLFSLGMLKGGR